MLSPAGEMLSPVTQVDLCLMCLECSASPSAPPLGDSDRFQLSELFCGEWNILTLKQIPFFSACARLARYDFYSPWDAWSCIPTVYVVGIGHEPSTVSRSRDR